MSIRIVSMTVGTSDPSAMEGPARRVSEETGIPVSVRCFEHKSAGSDPLVFDELCKCSADADLVLVRCVTDPDRFSRMDRFCEVLRSARGLVYIHSSDPGVRSSRRYLFGGTDEEFSLLGAYVGNKGEENDRALVRWLLGRTGADVEVPDPICQREYGIYHPDFPRDVSFGDYISALDASKPAVGILITGSQWIYGDLDHVDMLIRKLEAAGLSTIPVFFNTGSREGKLPMSEVFGNCFMDSGRSRVRLVITNSPFSQLMNSRKGGVRGSDADNFYSTMTDVPVLQATMVTGRYSDYEESKTTSDATNLMLGISWAEMDGQIITVPMSEVVRGDDGSRRNRPLEDRIDSIVGTALNWVRLGSKTRAERKVAVVLYQYGESGTIGGAAGLDSIASTLNLLRKLGDCGYSVGDIPGDPRALTDILLSGVNNDLGNLTSREIRASAPGILSRKEYMGYYSGLSGFSRAETEKAWGEPMGEVMTDRGDAVIPGHVFGNVLVTMQPVRSWADDAERTYHDPELYPPHQYLAFYRWLRDSFGADAVVHMGTHGSVEWLPGRTVALSSKCCPSYILDGMVNIYPYLIDDPGEGIQAKRRSEAVLIGHMPPTMARAGVYGGIADVERYLQEYIMASPSKDGARREVLLSAIRDSCISSGIAGDLRIPEDAVGEDFAQYLDGIHDYVMEIKDSLVRDGIHVLGEVPEGKLMDEAVYSLVRVPNGSVPSFRAAVAECMHGSEDDADDTVVELLGEFRARGYGVRECESVAEDMLGGISEDLRRCIGFVCGTVVPGLKGTADELDNVIRALDGRYVLPGPSGAPTRGHADLLPTGRNYYSIDPSSIPTRAAWEVGKRMADAFVERFVSDRGSYPREVGFVLWATDTMKTDGEDVAYVLYLMGVRPVWAEGGDAVSGLEIIPLDELGRPRADVTVRISGLFRDAYPNLISLIDDAVSMASSLDESDGDNALAANLRRDIAEAVSEGVGDDEARRRASLRVFGCPPGCYGSGMNHAVGTGKWKDTADLADMYAAWGSYAYGKGADGVADPESFARRFGRVQATVKNLPDREIDMVDMDDVYGYLGGLNAFVKTYGRKDALSYMGDSSDPGNITLCGTDEELRFVFRRKVLNPRFREGLKRHGFSGVSEVSKMTDYIFGWSATSGIVDKGMYDGLAETYLFDGDTAEWMEDENPHAMMDIVRRMLEAVGRGLWDADGDTRERLEELYMGLEERIEEISDR